MSCPHPVGYPSTIVTIVTIEVLVVRPFDRGICELSISLCTGQNWFPDFRLEVLSAAKRVSMRKQEGQANLATMLGILLYTAMTRSGFDIVDLVASAMARLGLDIE